MQINADGEYILEISADSDAESIDDIAADIKDDADEENTESEEAKEKQKEEVFDEETAVEAQNDDSDLRKRKKDAMSKNSCRGYAEGNKDGICKHYMKCGDCWADFK